MDEAIATGHRAIGPGQFPARPDELAAPPPGRATAGRLCRPRAPPAPAPPSLPLHPPPAHRLLLYPPLPHGPPSRRLRSAGAPQSGGPPLEQPRAAGWPPPPAVLLRKEP